MRYTLFIAAIIVSIAACTSTKNSYRSIRNNGKLMSDLNYYEGLKQYYGGATGNAVVLFTKSISLNKENDAAYYMLSQVYAAQNKRDLALKNAELAFKHDSTNKYYGLNYAQILQRSNKLDSALAIYSKLVELDSTDTDLLLNMSLIYGYKGNLKKSIQLFDEFSAKFGNSELILANKQKLYLQLNQVDSALSIGQRLVELYPDDPRHFTILGEIYGSMGNDSLAILYNKKALELVPNFPLAQIGLSDAYRREAKYPDYFRVLNAIFRNDDVLNKDKVNYFNQFLENKQFYQVFYPNIDTLINNFISTYPKDTSIYPIYAEHLTKMGKLNELNNFLHVKIDSGSKDTTLYYRFIELNFYFKRFDTTKVYSKRAIAIYPNLVKMYLYNSYSHFQLKEYDSTIAVLKTALPYAKTDSMKVDMLSMIGDSYHSMGKLETAFEYYDQALKINPKNIQVLNNYSYYLSLTDKNLSKALKMINVVLEKDPNNGTYLDTKAWILYKQEKYEEAKEVMRKALIYGGNDSSTILEHYGDILDKLNDKDSASMYWRMAYDKGNRSKELLKKLNLE
ncbi:tetratricopeptide repeat protein [Alistipes sp. ZOR0009]|uniref:tetratricopeptide repeat protein n=1 Tax=Alistipes sp. ZOR0009 TaxID=1339253 RepID=UPI0006473861|nr:tetratricopeptide repeat protein [Alistipes sp. ZOR0009]